MVYREGYVVTVRQNGQTLKEEAGKVVVPFHSDYELRLRNKTAKDVLAFVYIDGKPAVKGGVLVKGDSHLDLERFVEDNLNSGQRFRFVPLADSRVSDKGEHENGNIEVRFHAVKPFELRFNLPHIHHHHYRPYDYGEVTCRVDTGGRGICRSASQPSDLQLMANAVNLSAGATVGGTVSNQRFESVSLDYEKDSYVTLQVRLVGSGSIKESSQRFCTSCGSPRITGEKFCGNCGVRLSK